MNDDTKRTYIIASDEYLGSGYGMKEFVGSFRALLEELLGGLDAEITVYDAAEREGTSSVGEQTNEKLLELFDEANGDGQPYITVWSVDEHRKVLG